MKRKLAIAMCGILAVLMVGCGAEGDTNAPADESAALEESTVSERVDITDATELLTNVWNNYAEEEKFSIGGGDFDNSVMDAPGKYDVSKKEDMDSVLGLPQDCAELIDDAASIVHMMNANTFTAGAYHLIDPASKETLVDSVRDTILNRQWICGFPDKLLIAAVGDEYVVSAFGITENIEAFKKNLTECYDVTEIIYEESLE